MKRTTKASAIAFSKYLLEMERNPIDTSQTHEPKSKWKSDEMQTQSAIIDYLELLSIKGELFFQRTNNAPIFDGTHYRSMSKGQRKGFPDIVIVKNGKFIGVEVKSNKGEQSVDQREREKEILQAGGFYLLVRSLPFLEEMLKRY